MTHYIARRENGKWETFEAQTTDEAAAMTAAFDAGFAWLKGPFSSAFMAEGQARTLNNRDQSDEAEANGRHSSDY